MVRVVVCLGWRVLSCSQGASAVLGETWADQGFAFWSWGVVVHPAAPVIQTKLPLGQGGPVPTPNKGVSSLLLPFACQGSKLCRG